MKNVTKFFTLVIASLVLLFTGCNNLVDDGSVYEGTSTASSGTVRSVKLYATGDVDKVLFAPAPAADGRTILPDALDGNNLDFYLWYVNKLTGGTDPVNDPQKVTFYSTTEDYGRKGTIEIDLATSQYTLYLAAVEKGATAPTGGTSATKANDIKSRSYLFATATVDMRYNETVSFYLTPYAVTGNASVTIALTTSWAGGIPAPYNDANHIVASIRNINTNALVGTTTEIKNTAVTAGNNLTATELTYTASGVPAGTYLFVVDFINDSETGNTKHYYYTDTIIVLANQNINTAIDIPMVVGQAPAAPEAFHAAYVDPDNHISNYYNVQFTWTDKSINEQNFKIQLMDITGLAATSDADIAAVTAAKDESPAATTQAAAKTAWETLAGVAGDSAVIPLDQTVYANPTYYEAGSLSAGQTMLTVKLPLGKRYLARIAAENASGSSAYTYLAITETPTKVAYTKVDGTAVTVDSINAFDAAVTSISRFRIAYNLSGGAYKVGTYDASSKELTGLGANAARSNITTLTGALDADVRYYSQLGFVKLTSATAPADWAQNYTVYYKEVTGTMTKLTATETYSANTFYTKGNAVLNPLYVQDEVALSTDYYALASGKYEFRSWKVNSQDGQIAYRINNNAGRAALPLQVLTAVDSTGAALVAGYDSYYSGCSNVQLFASYGAMEVDIYNPADYQVLDRDVLLFKTAASTPAISSAVQITAVNKAGEFGINNGKFKNLYVAVRNTSGYGSYERIGLKIVREGDGEFSHQIYNVAAAAGTYTVSETAKRYVLLTKEPADWSAAKTTDYFKKDSSGMEYEKCAAGDAWAAGSYYYVDATSTSAQLFTYFDIDATKFAPGATYLITVEAYTAKNPKTPLTRVYTLNVINAAGSYRLSTFAPMTYAAGDYASDTTGTTGPSDWTKAGTYQED